MGNKQGADTQQMTDQPEHKNAQPMLPAVSIVEVVHQAPRLMEVLTPEGVKALTATCTQLRRDFCHRVTTIQMMNDQDSAMLCADKWPSLVMVVISTAVALAEKLCGDRLESCLADKGWSTIARLQLEQSPEGPTGQRSGGQQSVALIINASHQTSPDMDTKAHGSALACFAKKWEVKTQPMCMCLDSKSVHMDPLKHLQISRWPCLEWFTCHGNNDNALPISCFSGESSSNTQFATMSSCRGSPVPDQCMPTPLLSYLDSLQNRGSSIHMLESGLLLIT